MLLRHRFIDAPNKTKATATSSPAIRFKKGHIPDGVLKCQLNRTIKLLSITKMPRNPTETLPTAIAKASMNRDLSIRPARTNNPVALIRALGKLTNARKGAAPRQDLRVEAPKAVKNTPRPAHSLTRTIIGREVCTAETTRSVSLGSRGLCLRGNRTELF